MVTAESFVYESLVAHQDQIGLVDPDSLIYRNLAAGTTSRALLLDYTANGEARHLVMRLPREVQFTEQLRAEYHREYDIRTNVIPRSFAQQARPYYVEEEPVPHMVEEYLEGTHPPTHGAHWPNDHIRAFGATIAELHTATRRPLSEGAKQNPQILLEQHEDITGRTLNLITDSPSADYVKELNLAVLAELDTLAKTFEPSDTEALDHQDLVTSNIIFRAGKPYFIDWSEAAFVDPARGLARSYCNHVLSCKNSTETHLSPKREKAFIQSYQAVAGGGEAFLRRLQVWRAAFTASTIVKMAGVLYNPDAPHYWISSNQKLEIKNLKAAIIARQYPPTPF